MRTSPRAQRSSTRTRSRPASGMQSASHASTASSAIRLATDTGTLSASAASRTKARTSSPCSGSSMSCSSEKRATEEDVIDESAHVATVEAGPDQEGIPLNATPCQRPWVVAAQPHERPRDIGLRWFNHATFDDKLFSRSRVGWYEIQETKSGCVGHSEPARSRDTIVAREPRVAGVGTTPQSRAVGKEGTSPYCQRPRRQHGQHHASHHSDRRDHRSRWRLVRPGTLVLALPFLGQRG